MKIHSLVISGLLFAAGLLNGASSGEFDAKEAFSRLKSMAGEWQADTQMGKARLQIQLIAGGTSIVERETGEKMPEMLTVYHLDGNRLLLTHYCMAGNQPRMQARGFNPETGEVRFEFLDGTNMKADAGHMHNASMRLAGNDHLVTSWEFYENGKSKMTEKAEYTRVR